MSIRRTRWQVQIDIADLLDTGDDSDENAQAIGKAVADKLNEGLPAGHRLRDEALDALVESFRSVQSCDDLDGYLDELYDWGDYNKRLFINVI